MEPLTKRQQQILSHIEACQRDTGQTPTLREIADHFGFRSMNAARDHIRALCRKGALQQTPGHARSLRVVSPLRKLRSRVTDIPVYGDIPAGFADDRDQQPDGCITVDVETLGIRPTARTFALRVRGDSMIGAGILDGDFVIAVQQATAKHGEIVVAGIPGEEATVKTFQTAGDRVILVPANPDMQPLEFPSEDVTIYGRVVTVMRRL